MKKALFAFAALLSSAAFSSLTAQDQESPFKESCFKEALSNPATVSKADVCKVEFSFDGAPYVSPLLVEELHGSLADGGVVDSIDIASNGGNRFYCVPSVRKLDDRVCVGTKDKSFEYNILGVSDSGIHVVHCVKNGNGSGRFHSLLFLVFQKERQIEGGLDGFKTKQTTVLKRIGSVALGDRYSGELEFSLGTLRIGADKSPLPEHAVKDDLTLRVP